MSSLKIFPLGGMGRVTQNMFLYEVNNEILIVDCGIGFPDVYMPGVDAIIPDISYLLKQVEAGKKIVGMILSHGHDDHIAATPYLLPDLPDFPIYASPLTVGFAHQRLRDQNIDKEIKVVADSKTVKLSDNFDFRLINLTHSVPDTRHIAIRTPAGLIYHGSDFKIDKNPIDGVMTDLDMIKQIGEEGVLLMAIDCLRVERQTWTKSESAVGPAIEKEIETTKGKFVVTLMSSHLHRIQQVVNIAQKHNRKVVFIGRSVEQNVKVAMDLGKLEIPRSILVDKKYLNDYQDKDLCVVIAGSQGQEGSSMVRAVYGEHRIVQIRQDDKVIFSADVIPGNEVPYYNAIDELASNGIKVIYPAIAPDVHQSGHASSVEQKELVNLVKPKFVMPIGGQDRHRALFREFVTDDLGYTKQQVLTPKTGQILNFAEGKFKAIDQIKLNPSIVDGLGIGDVGPIVLSDRLALSKAGIVVVVIPSRKGRLNLQDISVISRGFVFMREAEEVVDFIKAETIQVIKKLGKKPSYDEVKRKVERKLSRKLYKIIKREPMIVPVIMES